MSNASPGQQSRSAPSSQARSAPFLTRLRPARVASYLAQVGPPQGAAEPSESVAALHAHLAETQAPPTLTLAHNTDLAAALRHARYILSENVVTGFAFALFILIVLAALIGPYLLPYDPLASDTASALKAPSAAHWFGTDQLGRDVFSRVIVATRLGTYRVERAGVSAFLMAGPPRIPRRSLRGRSGRLAGRLTDPSRSCPTCVLAL